MTEERMTGERRHITWSELRERYGRAETFEERLGLIHATRTAVIGWERDSLPSQRRAALEGIEMLTVLGNETWLVAADLPDPLLVERNSELRRHARIALARHFVGAWVPDGPTIPERKHSVPASAIEGCGWDTSDESKLGHTAVERLVRFYGSSAEHLDGLDDKNRDRVRDFIEKRWQWQFSNEREFVPRAALINATMHLRAYEFLARYVALDAIPVLFRNIVAFLNKLRRREGKEPYMDTLRTYSEQRFYEADLRHAFIVCAEVLDPTMGQSCADAYNNTLPQAHALLALLAHHERTYGEPIVSERAAER